MMNLACSRRPMPKRATRTSRRTAAPAERTEEPVAGRGHEPFGRGFGRLDLGLVMPPVGPRFGCESPPAITRKSSDGSSRQRGRDTSISLAPRFP